MAVAFLVVLLASVISKASRDDVSNAAQQTVANEPSEPLAELGVAPGAADTSNMNNNNSSAKK